MPFLEGADDWLLTVTVNFAKYIRWFYIYKSMRPCSQPLGRQIAVPKSRSDLLNDSRLVSMSYLARGDVPAQPHSCAAQWQPTNFRYTSTLFSVQIVVFLCHWWYLIKFPFPESEIGSSDQNFRHRSRSYWFWLPVLTLIHTFRQRIDIAVYPMQRRHHRKSRFGCKRCKMRRMKVSNVLSEWFW